MKFAETLRELRTKNNLSQIEFARNIGVSRSTVGMYETGQREPDFETMEAIADFFNVTMDYLYGKTNIPNEAADRIRNTPNAKNIIPMPKMNKVPLLGTIACGEPILAEENIECDVDVPDHIKADFALRCKGNSMIDVHINDGDIVYIRQQSAVDNGQIAAVLIGDEATLKKVYISGDTLTLVACNSAFAPLIYSGAELEEIRILGKAVAYTSII